MNDIDRVSLNVQFVYFCVLCFSVVILGFYESAVAAYQMLLPIFQESCDYRKQMQCHQDLVALTETLIDEVIRMVAGDLVLTLSLK